MKFSSKLLDDRNYSTGTNGTATLTDSETQTLLHSYWMNQLDCHLNVVARHAHLCTFRKLANACNVCCSEVELRTIVVEERCMTAALVFSKNVNLSCEFLVAGYGTRFNKTLTSLDLCSLNTTKKSTDVAGSLCRCGRGVYRHSQRHALPERQGGREKIMRIRGRRASALRPQRGEKVFSPR